ncbi:hypothetical protein RRG08_019654 [Elysia crispata]|uniref:Uncharacterized protein n=1 Tax=Elysia crispata TaxID=231223 RepID=A0AAE1E7X0_9GAST|nr:hypothetical protein RRG08_019654 [Elysia crispata]
MADRDVTSSAPDALPGARPRPVFESHKGQAFSFPTNFISSLLLTSSLIVVQLFLWMGGREASILHTIAKSLH